MTYHSTYVETDFTPMIDRIAKQVQWRVDHAALEKVAGALEEHGYVKVVRCRDCRFARPEPKSDIKSRKPYQGGYWCDELSEGIGLFCDPDCFCSWAERREP